MMFRQNCYNTGMLLRLYYSSFSMNKIANLHMHKSGREYYLL